MTNTAAPDASRPAIRLKGVVKTYPGADAANRVLNGIDLRVERGCSVFLAGPSGSGKTTLLSIIGCILSADEGQIEILGDDVAALNAPQRTLLRRERIGFVFQRFHLIRGLTAAENVGVPLLLRGLAPRDVHARAAALLETVGLADKRHARTESLSTGQSQRVALARALANDPELILADEPTASLDAANGHNMMELLWRLTVQQARTVVVVTHDPRIFSFAHRVYWLDNGNIVEQQDTRVGAPPTSPGIVLDLPPTLPGFSPLPETQG